MTTDAQPIETEPRNCATCGQVFDRPIFRDPLDPSRILNIVAKHCPRCVEREKDRMAKATAVREHEEREAKLAAAWDRICPPKYRTPLEGGDTDVSILSASLYKSFQPAPTGERPPPAPCFDEIVAHPFGAQGLILRGNTGVGKTRAMFRLLRVYFVSATRPRIVAMTAGEFDRQARDAAGNFTLSDWFQRLAGADVLFIDDLGKGRWTAATAAQFWEIVDDRTKHNRPIFLTTNCTGDTLVASIGLDKDISEPLLRRLRESCKLIVCVRNTTTTA